MIRWLISGFRRFFGGGQVQLYRVGASADTTAPTVVFGMIGR